MPYWGDCPISTSHKDAYLTAVDSRNSAHYLGKLLKKKLTGLTNKIKKPTCRNCVYDSCKYFWAYCFPQMLTANTVSQMLSQ